MLRQLVVAASATAHASFADTSGSTHAALAHDLATHTLSCVQRNALPARPQRTRGCAPRR
ncbi:hypothetical protein A7D16_16870 [Xanthomonas nasturtii]|nr:hypothetical protein A7D16_16870 [Xanthomonas nasturtii]